MKVADSATLVKEPCPPCRAGVRVVCMGGHTEEVQLCSEKRQYSCGRVCERPLSCGSHYCQRECHEVCVSQCVCVCVGVNVIAGGERVFAV